MDKLRHAILLVHGQGEQRPMEMGPQFVENVFMADFDPVTANDSSNPQIRWLAENQSGIKDTRRIEVRFDDKRDDFDIFEFYWAPLLDNNQLSHFYMWFFGLLARSRKELPNRVRLLHTISILVIWCALLLTSFYYYTTVSALFPVQVVQIYRHGWSDILHFSFDWRLTAVLSAAILLSAALITAAGKRYGWCLSFVISTIGICAICPLALGTDDRISEDIDWIIQQNDNVGVEDLNIWGLPFNDDRTVTVGSVSASAASVSRWLCGKDAPRGEVDYAAGEDPALQARRTIDLSVKRSLDWSDLTPKRGVQLKDMCLAPVALVNPALYARVADSAHILFTTIIAIFFAIYYCCWRVFLKTFIVNIMGDSARYLNSHPRNNIERHSIREAGSATLQALHDSKRYDRIFVIAHSLGSIIAYDVLRQFWGHLSAQGITCDGDVLERAKAAALRLDDVDESARALNEWQEAQLDLYRSTKGDWPISDFITLGSPLSHGRLLLESSSDAVHPSARFASQRDITRSVLACPPVDVSSATARLGPWDMFLVAKWTNLFFDDDLVGGPVSMDSDGPLFGSGVRDLKFEAKKLAVPGLSHNSYWMSRLRPTNSSDVPWLHALRSMLGTVPTDGVAGHTNVATASVA